MIDFYDSSVDDCYKPCFVCGEYVDDGSFEKGKYFCHDCPTTDKSATNSKVILLKSSGSEVINAPKEICFKEFAYPQLDVDMIELIQLDEKYAVLIDEEGLFKGWDSQQVIYKGSQVAVHFVGNGMIVDVSEEEKIKSLTNESIENFYKLYKIENVCSRKLK